ncbi:hypothetical protein GCM10019016_045250 [Streptomyces prasinosporus]|uniref:Uncharacterized protein n=1 Tax=Streptomyces prasinosporus TaxID=68256 RepID=A0ABP6TQ39_9ACTN
MEGSGGEAGGKWGDEGPGRSPLPTGSLACGSGRGGGTPPSCAFDARAAVPDPMR